VPAAHLIERRIALVRGGVPVEAVPLGSQELAEWVSLGEADAHAERPQLLERRGAEVV
jgi:hypothetical protein